MSVPLQVSLAPSHQATAALIQELVKHYLFVRNQIPGLFCDLEQQQVHLQARSCVNEGKASLPSHDLNE